MKRFARAAMAAVLVVVASVVPVSGASAGPSVDVHAFGSAPALGAPDMLLNGKIVDMAAHPAGGGYWLLGRDGGVFSYGVPFFGSTGGMRLNAPVVGMTPTPSGSGYWFVADDGGVFSYGGARFYGSTGSIRLVSPVVGMAATKTGRGYWLAAADGGVFAFGDARFHGSMAGWLYGSSVRGIVASPSGNGYVLLGSRGELFSFGDATRFPTLEMPSSAVDVALSPSGAGAYVLGRDGSVYTYGDAVFRGTPSVSNRNAAALAVRSGGYWVATVPRDADGPAVPAGSGSGRRVVYSNSGQRIWLVEADSTVAHTFLVSGRRGVPSPGTYRVFSKSPMSSAHGGSLRLPYMTRFAWGSSLAIGFHGIPLRSNGTPIQTDAELGQYRSAGCVRMNQQQVKVLYDWAPVGTPVVVLP